MHVGVGLGCEQAVEHFGRATQNVRLGLELRDIDASRSHRTWSSRWKTCSMLLIRTDGRQQAPFRPGLADMPALHVAGEDDRRVIAQDLAGVDMTQGPVVITSEPKFLERAGRVPLVAIRAAHAGVKQPDVDAAGHGRRIGRGQVFRDGGLGEALPVDRHVQVVEPHGLGTIVGQEAGHYPAGAAHGSSCWRRRGCRR